nr:ABC transporter permease [Paracoccus sp. IB05]
MRALDGVSLTIHAGEMVAITGASGSGKSTLMNVLGCLDRPDAGRCIIAGEDTARLGPDDLARLRRRHFGFIFQRYHLMPGLTAQGNVEVPAIYDGLGTAARAERARSLLTRLGLGDRLSHYPNQMSGGQQQRVSIARALMNGGEVILADEPTGALDPESARVVMEFLHELNRAGHTIIIVTHDMRLAAQAGRVIEMQAGRIIADRKTGDQMPDQPATGRIALPARRGNPLTLLANAGHMALAALIARPLRAMLTMLGIVIGIAAVVAVTALGEGSRRQMSAQLDGLGTATLEIYPGTGWGDEKADQLRTLVAGDALALSAQPYVQSASPVVQTSARGRVGNQSLNVSISGVGPDFLDVRGRALVAGRMFDASDLAARAPVAVIDATTAERFFPGGSALGQSLMFDQFPAKVIGIVARSRDAGQSLELFMPHTAVTTRISGAGRLSAIVVRLRDGTDSAQAEGAITAVMLTRHGVKDFFVFNNDQLRRAAEASLGTLALLISAVAGIALVVGGIGVMNIMLVSVTERISEIGLRMAVGARRLDIMAQFLIEALVLCLVGAAAGIGLALGAGWILRDMAPLVFSPQAILTATIAASGIGLIFGFFPARNAARLDPIEALNRS